ncbi:MAG: heavy metal-responsive transcriptional regulator [Xanthomonadales bacterium]|nr:heavy metal-responsive transcriptional regulator [Xanthomonadales bacterium]
MTIGKLAKCTGVTTDTIRFYEDEGILLPVEKTDAGYRLYDSDAVRRLVFIRHAQRCGMSLSEIRQLLDLKTDDRSCCGDVRALAKQKQVQLEEKIRSMVAMSQALSELIETCTVEDRSTDDCPILAALESRLDVPRTRPFQNPALETTCATFQIRATGEKEPEKEPHGRNTSGSLRTATAREPTAHARSSRPPAPS